MPRLLLFFKLIVRPLLREPMRLALTIAAVALGVAVVLAIDLAGNAAAGSFRSSMESLAGDNDLEIVATGSVPEAVAGTISRLPFAIQISPRIEDYAVIAATGQTVPVIGLDLVAEGSHLLSNAKIEPGKPGLQSSDDRPESDLFAADSIWVNASFPAKPGDTVSLVINDHTFNATVRGRYPDAGSQDPAILMDIAAAQVATGRLGRIDRLLAKLPPGANIQEWAGRLAKSLPSGVTVRPQGTGTDENRKMLAAFRWNLRLLSYIALVVGAFLIFNTISVSVVRRRAEIGIVRALGATQRDIMAAFLGEAACIGLAGACIAIPLGRFMATGAVKLMSLTVEALYVTSKPGSIALTWSSLLLALLLGIAISTASAAAPAREAMQVSPVEAMGRGRREYAARVNQTRDLLIAVFLAIAGSICAQLPPVTGKPLFGYLATILLIAASSFAIPAMVSFLAKITSNLLRKLVGVEGLLASRSLASSLRRTAVLVATLSTAVAMMVSVGIMVGSFRQTVMVWMDNQLPADLYLRPAGDPASDRHPTISLDLVDKIAALPGVDSVDRLRAYEISYEGMPATLASVDLKVLRSYHRSDFLSGRRTEDVLGDLRGQNTVIVSEPFTYKHKVRTGDTIPLALGDSRADFKIVDVYFDYASEKGYILMDRDTLLRYLPDPTPSNLAVFVQPGVRPEDVRRRIEQVSAGRHILVFSDQDLRREAIRIFDRTFAITYALEAVAVCVAVMGMAGALLALVIDRRRELGLLRFFGASSSQVRKLILVEAGLIGLLANLAGFCLGYFLSLILVFVINRQSFGWTIRFHWPIAVLLGALSVVYLATLLSGFYPARVAVRINPLEVVHED